MKINKYFYKQITFWFGNLFIISTIQIFPIFTNHYIYSKEDWFRNATEFFVGVFLVGYSFFKSK
ncbi:hypothetical protein ABN16_08810 [Levilactobacillus koreensis]|uniref:Uncharacterized protein n=1 Tax=Levilactobacillus koreensis TaxID=637971 RepID=A0AAC8UV74_9LACO|nr:hypothetical protein ABN16_08810 [Levilactobacillus koreensis]